eukprot:scaffold837_cov255-Pinguiococcus_pyrenoidosus.AAC.4
MSLAALLSTETLKTALLRKSSPIPAKKAGGTPARLVISATRASRALLKHLQSFRRETGEAESAWSIGAPQTHEGNRFLRLLNLYGCAIGEYVRLLRLL